MLEMFRRFATLEKYGPSLKHSLSAATIGQSHEENANTLIAQDMDSHIIKAGFLSSESQQRVCCPTLNVVINRLVGPWQSRLRVDNLPYICGSSAVVPVAVIYSDCWHTDGSDINMSG